MYGAVRKGAMAANNVITKRILKILENVILAMIPSFDIAIKIPAAYDRDRPPLGGPD
jgi:hypothetical protein